MLFAIGETPWPNGSRSRNRTDVIRVENRAAHSDPLEVRLGSQACGVCAARFPSHRICACGSSPVTWRAIAKDGADLPISQATERPARQVVSVGETYDFEFEPQSASELRLEVFRPARAAMGQSQIVVPIHVH